MSSEQYELPRNSWRVWFDGLGWLVLAGVILLGQMCIPLIFSGI